MIAFDATQTSEPLDPQIAPPPPLPFGAAMRGAER